jgi:F-type H+-transporting ATPase subunit gamma
VKYVDLSAFRNIGADAAHVVGEALLELFHAGEFDVATLFYSQFKSVISQVPTALQLIPARAPDGVKPPDLKGAVYEYEPSEEEILEALLPQYLSGQILQSLLENQAGFYGAQMSAMDNATRNAGDLIKKLTTRYNRQRQANITKELIEIISGAEAL